MERQVSTFGQGDADRLNSLLDRAGQILIKKLSNNDREWAKPKLDGSGNRIPGRWMNNQAGVYIPHAQRDSGFFPPLELKARTDGGSDEIRECFVTTLWPQADDERRESRLVHYTSKGPETHLTGLPKNVFSELMPASFFVMGRVSGSQDTEFECLTIDSGSDEGELLADIFDLGPRFVIGIFEPAAVRTEERERILAFGDQVIRAWLGGTIEAFAQANAAMPTTAALARMAQKKWMAETGHQSLDPFALDQPGDVLRDISRSIEWELFRDYQRRERSVELVRAVLGDKAISFTASDLIGRLVDGYHRIDRLMLSAGQQRKSRAGYSYEHHIEAMLLGGGIPFEKQVIVEARKRPDFMVPSFRWLDGEDPATATGLILSAKTTLRERWKQVEREKGARRLFLTTVDENIAGNAIEDMASFGVCLVVPESLLNASETEYHRHGNVTGFKEFCEIQLRPNLSVWRGAGPA
jgi:EcoRII C terminal